MFKIEDYNNKKIAIHVKTQEEYDKLIGLMKKSGVINIDERIINGFKNNEEYTCMEIRNEKCDFSFTGWYKDSDFQIVEFSDIIPFTKSDLQDTDIVTFRNGKTYLVKGFISDGLLNEDLTYTNYNKLDIIKVERPTNLVTVFEREEKIKVSLDELKEYYEKNTGKKVEVE